jgi:hypothetical protein
VPPARSLIAWLGTNGVCRIRLEMRFLAALSSVGLMKSPNAYCVPWKLQTNKRSAANSAGPGCMLAELCVNG